MEARQTGMLKETRCKCIVCDNMILQLVNTPVGLHSGPYWLQSARGLPYANAVWALSVWETVQPTPAWFNAFCRYVFVT